MIPELIILALLAAWNLFLYKRSGGRARSPLWMAFSTTAAAVLFLVAGAIGYNLDTRDRFIAQSAWTDSVIWWEIGVGLGIALVAANFWRRGLQRIRPA